MRILLIQPPKAPTVIGGEDLHIYEPLDLEYIAAGVSDRHSPKILDMRFDKDLEGCLADFAPDIIGLTAYTTHVYTVIALCRRIKAARPAALTVVGGHHATALPCDFEVEGVDVIVVGEGVFSFQEIVAAHEQGPGRVRALLDAQGAAGSRTLRSRYDLTPLDRYPFPRRDLTREHRGQYFSEWMKPMATIVTSKGCPFRCSYCCLWRLTDGGYLERSPESIVEELEGIREENVFFADAESMINASRMARVAELIKERGIHKKYYCYSRSDTVLKNPELFKQWRGIGLERLFLGFEFFKDDQLVDVHKRATVRENEQAMRFLNDLDISMIASFMIKPDFEKDDFRAFADYCLRLKKELKFSIFLFSVLTPLPGSDFYDSSKEKLISTNYEHFDLFHPVLPTKLSKKEYFEELYRLYRELNGPQALLPTLKRFRMLDIPKTMQRYHRLMKQMQVAYRDYGAEPAERERAGS